ncbi:hypothetical protein J2W32_000975 [Variovorax boronicumulans]|uniref:Uncharacterized protein n=1 Tax=Variovorax boronicumulans TaxID=436515 RepID=A0AAW8CTH8_9BURK|nr:hypothetical protein [Variovorax boronicumulans]MDP9892581.1 hypothetical protein [Variovorax boronicumulans]MDQ0051939.1 hypothetical protein [Variovorax boronicumulans]
MTEEEAQKGWGGVRPGQGRKPLVGDKPLIGVTLKMSEEQRAKLQRLGGAQWVRDRIDKAKSPKE